MTTASTGAALLERRFRGRAALSPDSSASSVNSRIGTITAAPFVISWSHPGRIRSEAAFAALGGAAPIPASSGPITRYRLNRRGDRQLNRALRTVALTRPRIHEPTKTYAARRTLKGKTPREIKRCFKRAIAREVYRLMENEGDCCTDR